MYMLSLSYLHQPRETGNIILQHLALPERAARLSETLTAKLITVGLQHR